MSTFQPQLARAAAQQSNNTSHPDLVQRKDAEPANECEECRGKKPTQRQPAPGGADDAGDGSPRPAQRAGRSAGHDFSKMSVHSAEVAGRTGVPTGLMSGLQQLSGTDLSAVRVHYNSEKPSQLDALAYTQGTDIHIAPGEERHLAHEAWHVVQQMQGRVKPTAQINGTPLNDDASLEREADVMGEKALALGSTTAPSAYQTRFGGADTDDEPYTTQLMPARPVVQRATNFAAGTITATMNMASHVIAGGRDSGFTPPTLNGPTILSAAAAIAAIKKPVLSGQSNMDGTVDAFVASVPTNEASFTMRVPNAGPWSTATTKAAVAAVFTSMGFAVPAACTGAASSTFSIKGKPTDADFAANTRTHEDLHAADHKTGFDAVIVPWDTKVEAAKSAMTMFNGANQAAAEAALWTAMGGTPDQIATAQHNKWIALNRATHAAGTTLATGGPGTPSNPVADATCGTASLDAT